MKVAFIGLGNMGAPMARNLIRAGHDVTVYNRTRAKAESLATNGARIADSVAQFASFWRSQTRCSARLSSESTVK